MTNFKEIIDPRRDQKKLLAVFPRTKSIDFMKSNNFREFKRDFTDNLEQFMLSNNFHEKSIERVLHRYKKECKYFSIVGKGEQINFVWSNGELKNFSIFNDAIVSIETYWLKSYPFLEMNNKNNMARVNPRFQEYAIKRKIDNYLLTCPSHNSHFGHFIFDDYPKCLLDKLSFNPQLLNPLSITPVNRGIREMLTELGYFETVLEKDLSKTDGNHSTILSCENLHQSFITNPIINIYVLHSIFSRLAEPSDNSNQDESLVTKFFLYRGSKYDSRIANFKEIKEFLINNDFQIIEPTSFTNKGLIKKLRTAKQVVCESGSTTLVSSLFTPPHCQIIALMPEEMIYNPDDNMIESGLPYHLVRPALMKIIYGKSVEKSVIQSSRKCIYSIEELGNAI